MLEVAGSNPASAANDGRVAQRIERVTISPPLVAKVPLRADAGKITLSGNSGFDSRRRKRRNPANLAAHPFSGTADRCLGKLQLIRVSQVRILPRPKRVAQLVEHRLFPKNLAARRPPFFTAAGGCLKGLH